ncbi:hypothetical protein NliqN6_5766 [Naganishia liquefaciens]|uniref:DUF605-domain-containing protein n=1 Tax=Naganishia liquefaciens TaxID=104408 RepID=A0A8H3YH15_9TREE|nr:hypothetical protein NliqN6_5766 [Naganishia liquefaciens]
MDIPAEAVPAELKPTCEQILRRARELRKADPVMSYWCCFSAASASMKLPTKRSHEANKFLMNLLDILESMKSSLLDANSGVEHATITDEAAGSAYVENFAIKVFLQADNEDRAGKATKATVRKFVVASQFMDVLRCFDPPNGMRDELEQKQQYARWKAADIAKALKEGRTPTPGPPGGEDEQAGKEEQEPVASSDVNAVASPSTTLPRLPNLPSSPPETPSSPAPDPSPSSPPSTSLPSPPPSDHPLPRRASGGFRRTSTSSETKQVRFAGMDEPAPSSPPSSPLHVNSDIGLDPHATPNAPPPTAGEPPVIPLENEPTDSILPSAPVTLPSAAQPLPSAPLPPPSPPPFSTPQPPASAPPAYPETLDPKTLERCQKHARWAISALDYEDLETARKELRLALDLVEGRSEGG